MPHPLESPGPPDPTWQGVQVCAGNVPDNSLVLRCASHLHLLGREGGVDDEVDIILSTSPFLSAPGYTRTQVGTARSCFQELLV